MDIHHLDLQCEEEHGQINEDSEKTNNQQPSNPIQVQQGNQILTPFIINPVTSPVAKFIHIQCFRGEPGGNPRHHLDSLKMFFKFQNMTEEEKVAISSHHLKESARDWWNTLSDQPVTFREYEQAVMSMYWSAERQEGLIYSIMHERYPANHQETYAQFFVRQVNRIKTLNAFNYPEMQIVRMIRHNMPLWIRKILISSQVQDIEGTTRILTAIEYEYLDEDRNEKEVKFQNKSIAKQKSTNLSRVKNREAGPSHTAIVQQKDNEDIGTNSNPVIQVTINDNEIQALVDSGSQVSIISKKLATEYESNPKYLKFPMRPIQLTLANGRKMNSERYQMWLEMKISGKCFNHAFLVMEGLLYDLVLGSDFLQQYQGIIHYPMRKCMLEGIQVPFTIVAQDNHPIGSCVIQVIDEEMIKQKVGISMIRNNEHSQQLQQILQRYAAVFSGVPGKIRGYTHRIRLREESYHQTKTYPIPFQYKEEVDKQIKQMLEWDIIERAPSPYNNPLIVIKKKNGNVRLCLDARRLNNVTIPERDVPPPMHETFVQLAGKTVFSTMDMTASYWQMPLDQRDRKYTAFRYKGQTHVFKRVPFGLINSGAGLMRCLKNVLSPQIQEHMVCYVDDIVIASKDIDEHLRHLESFFRECIRENITINMEKSFFAVEEIEFLGHVVNSQGVKPHPAKIEAIKNFPTPTNQKQVRAFLGLCNFYHRFYPRFAYDTTQLIELIKKSSKKWEWKERHEQEMSKVKDKFLETVMLYHPDFSRPFYLQTDSSRQGLGAVLFQIGDKNEHQVLYFISRTLRGAEKHYTTTEQETLAIVWACQKLKQFLLGSEVVIITDHKCLEFLNKSFLNNDRLIRWSLILQQFRYSVIYCPGSQNIVADILSRHPMPMAAQNPDLGNQAMKIMTTTAEKTVESHLQNLAYWQSQDAQYKKIINIITSKMAASRHYNQYRITDGILQINTKSPHNPWKVIIPHKLRHQIITHIHQSVGHYGPRKVEEAIKRQFYWPGMYSQILRVLKTCEICARSKAPNRSYAGEPQPILASKPNELLAVDHYGPLPMFRRFQYLFVTYDVFSKYVKAYPVRTANARGAIKALREKQLPEVGKPQIVISDHGTAFTSKEWKTWMAKQGIHHRLTSIRNPQANPCERVMREIGRLFRTYIPTNHRDWVNKTEKVVQYINNTMNESTGFTPTRLHYGKECPQLFKTKMPMEEEKIDKLQDQKIAYERLKRAALHRKNKKRNQQYQFRQGEQVWLRDPRPSNTLRKEFKKFFPIYQGPYTLKKECGRNAFLLEDNNGIKGVYNARNLKPCIPPDPGKYAS